MSKLFTRIYRFFFASVALVALLIQLYASREFVVDFFSYFTMLSNIAALSLLFFLSAQKQTTKNHNFDLFRGAITLYMTITGVVYWTILRNQPNLAVYPWINLWAHGVMPIVMLVDWISHPPATKLSLPEVLKWLLFPILYLVYSLVRGHFVNWYPYFFINPHKTSYPDMAVYVVGVLGLGAVLAIGLLKLSRRKV